MFPHLCQLPILRKLLDSPLSINSLKKFYFLCCFWNFSHNHQPCLNCGIRRAAVLTKGLSPVMWEIAAAIAGKEADDVSEGDHGGFDGHLV